jgi:hypothetical protein
MRGRASGVGAGLTGAEMTGLGSGGRAGGEAGGAETACGGGDPDAAFISSETGIATVRAAGRGATGPLDSKGLAEGGAEGLGSGAATRGGGAAGGRGGAGRDKDGWEAGFTRPGIGMASVRSVGGAAGGGAGRAAAGAPFCERSGRPC